MRGGCSQKDPAGVSCTGLLRSQPGGPSPFRPRNLFATASLSHRRASVAGCRSIDKRATCLHRRDDERDADLSAHRANAGPPSILSANPGKVAGSTSVTPVGAHPASRPFAFDVRPRSDSTHAACACRSSAQPARVHLPRRSTPKPCPCRTLVNATVQGAAILRVARISLGAMGVQ